MRDTVSVPGPQNLMADTPSRATGLHTPSDIKTSENKAVPAASVEATGGDEVQVEELVAGQAEASGQLQLGDVVLSIHGVDVRGIGTEDTCRLVMAAPRPFEMRFLRRNSQ